MQNWVINGNFNLLKLLFLYYFILLFYYYFILLFLVILIKLFIDGNFNQ